MQTENVFEDSNGKIVLEVTDGDCGTRIRCPGYIAAWFYLKVQLFCYWLARYGIHLAFPLPECFEMEHFEPLAPENITPGDA